MTGYDREKKCPRPSARAIRKDIRGAGRAKLAVVVVRGSGYRTDRSAAGTAKCRAKCRNAGHRTQDGATGCADRATAYGSLFLRSHIRAGRRKKKHRQNDSDTG